MSEPRRKLSPWWLLLAAPFVLALCLLAGATGSLFPERSILLLRLDRVWTGFVVGAALASSGAVLQSVLRNPLAEPYILGLSGGAALGAALTLATGLAAICAWILPLTAFAAAAATLAAVYALARIGGRLSVYGLVLSGVIVSSVCGSLLLFVVTLAPERLPHVLWWTLGNLEIHSRPLLTASSVLIAAGVAGTWLLARDLNALALGQDMAHYVGVRTRTALTLALALATLSAASAVALAGLVGFVGLVVPHAIRGLTGTDHRRLLPASALAGGMFLAVCDAVGRVLLAPREIPVGVITALIGGPFFLVVLRRPRKEGWLE